MMFVPRGTMNAEQIDTIIASAPGVPIGLGFWRMRLTLPQNGIRDRFANAIRSRRVRLR
jgi:hypothetical protein